MPIMEVDGQVVGQTGGISRFCGKLSGLYPKNDDMLAATTDITNLVDLTMRENV